MRALSMGLKVVAVWSTLLIFYNMWIFREEAAGKHTDYIPWLHFPIKAFVWFLVWLHS